MSREYSGPQPFRHRHDANQILFPKLCGEKTAVSGALLAKMKRGSEAEATKGQILKKK